jgi:hypothetical protein
MRVKPPAEGTTDRTTLGTEFIAHPASSTDHP